MPQVVEKATEDDPDSVAVAILGFLKALIVLVFLFGLYAIDRNWLSSSRISDYSVMCTEYQHGRCGSGRWSRLPFVLYTVNANEQIVVRQKEGQPPERLSNCAVINKRNWKCTQVGNFEIGFTGGDFWRVTRKRSETPQILVSVSSTYHVGNGCWRTRLRRGNKPT